MRPVTPYALAIAMLVQAALALPTLEAQASGPTACSLIDPAELMRVTGRKDILNRGPQAYDGRVKGLSECGFLELSFALTSNMTPEWFNRNREMVKNGKTEMKVEPVSGIGDEAYYMWDSRPGSNRQVGIVFRSGTKQMAIGDLAPSDSIEAYKKMTLSVAKLLAPKLK
jgi:hypothetical protein